MIRSSVRTLPATGATCSRAIGTCMPLVRSSVSQRGDPRVDPADAGRRPQRPAVPPVQGGAGVGAGAVSRKSQSSPAWAARRGRTADDAAPASCSGGANRDDRRGKTGLLHPATMGCQGLGGRRTDGPARVGGLRQDLRLDARESARALGRQDRYRRLSRQQRLLRPRPASFPRRTPTKTIATTAAKGGSGVRPDHRRDRSLEHSAVKLVRARAQPMPGMRWIPGGTFAMGSEDFYPEERPVHRVTVDGFWMDEHPVTGAEFRRFVARRGYVTVAERPLDPAQYPDAHPELLVPGSLVFRKTAGPGRPRRLPQLVGVRAGRVLEATRAGTGTTIDGRDQHPVVHVAYEDAEAYAALGRQGAADRGRVGVRRARRARGRRLRLGRRALPGRQGDGQHLAGRVPLAEPRSSTATRGRRRSAASRRTATACTTWPATSGSGRRDWFSRAPARGRQAVLRPAQPARRDRAERREPGEHDPAPGDQGRLAPLRAELLPALPARGAPRRRRSTPRPATSASAASCAIRLGFRPQCALGGLAGSRRCFENHLIRRRV